MPDKYSLISYEEAVEQACANPDEVEKSWLLSELKHSPEIRTRLKETVFQKIAQSENGNSPQAILLALARIKGR